MGVLTLADFRAQLQDDLGRPSLDSTRMDRWINAAYREIAYAMKFRELEAEGSFVTVDGTASYSLVTAAPSFRMLHEEGLRKTAPTEQIGKLKKETRASYFRKIGDTSDSTTRGDPRWYHRFGVEIFLRPIPDSTVVTVVFDYWKKITALSAVGHTTELSDDWDDAVYTGALYRGFRAQGERDKYLNTRADFLGAVRSRALDEDIEEFPEGGLNIQFDSDAALENDTDS